MADPAGSPHRLQELEVLLEQRSHDMQSLQHAQSMLSRKLGIFDAMHPLLMHPETIEKNLEVVMDALVDKIQVEAGSILLIDFVAKEFFFACARGPVAEDILKIRFPSDKGLAGAAAQGPQTLSLSDVSSDPRFYREITDQLGFEVRSLLAVPITWKGTAIGVIELINHLDSNDFIGYEVATVEKVAALTATLIALGERLRGN